MNETTIDTLPKERPGVDTNVVSSRPATPSPRSDHPIRPSLDREGLDGKSQDTIRRGSTEQFDQPETIELRHIPKAFHDLANQITGSIIDQVPPDMPRPRPVFAIHPLLTGQYPSLGHGGVVLIPQNEIHMGLDLYVPMTEASIESSNLDKLSSGFEDRNNAVRGTLQTLTRHLNSFVANHSSNFDLDSLQDYIQRMRDARSLAPVTDGTYPIYMYIEIEYIPDSLRQAFVDQVLLPCFSKDPFYMEQVEQEAKFTFAHEYGHLLFELFAKQHQLLNDEEIATIKTLFKDIWDQRTFGFTSRIDKLHIRNVVADAKKDKTGKRAIESEYLQINRDIIGIIADGLDSNMRERYLLSANLRGESEHFARAFTKVVGGRDNPYGLDLVSYVVNPFVRLDGGESVVAAIVREIRISGVKELPSVISKSIDSIKAEGV